VSFSILLPFVADRMPGVVRLIFCAAEFDSHRYSTFYSITSDTPGCTQREAAHSLPAGVPETVIRAWKSLRAV
jgi:hypothetical protein